jgi:hypothetical protein
MNDTNQSVTLVVIGTVGCDKPAVIRKGLKGYRLSDPTSLLTPPTMQGHHLSCIHFFFTLFVSLAEILVVAGFHRHGRIAHHEGLPDYFLNVIDVDVPTQVIDSDDLSWPGQLSRVDGAIICYDSSDEHSFKPVEGLLRTYPPNSCSLITLVLIISLTFRRV